MKILELVPYCFVQGHPNATRNKSGLAYMIGGIVEMLSRTNQVFVYSQSILTPMMRISRWVLLNKSSFRLFQHLSVSYLFLAPKYFRFVSGWKMKLRIIYYFLSAGLAEYYIDRIRPDVVHIHGFGPISIPFFLLCSKRNIPIVTTLHGLNFCSRYSSASARLKELEIAFIRYYLESGCLMTFVSSGMKRVVESELGHAYSNIKVVNNAFDESLMTGLAKNSGGSNDKRIICVGSISRLKNQMQVVRVLPKVQRIYQSKNTFVSLTIVGDGPERTSIENYVLTNSVSNVEFTGRMPQVITYQLMANADVLVFPSIEDGFGLPMIEAMRLGVPVVTFPDLFSVSDIFSADCMVLAEDRSDNALVNAILTALEENWNKETIVNHAQLFNYDTIAPKYNEAILSTTKPLDKNVMDLALLGCD